MPLTAPPLTAGTHLGTPNFQWRSLADLEAPDAYASASAGLALATAGAGLYFSNICKSNQYVQDTDGLFDVRANYGKACNGAVIAFYGTGADNKTFGFDLVAFRDNQAGCPGQIVFRSTAAGCILGSYDCPVYPVLSGANLSGAALTGFWCDTIVSASNTAWPTGVTITDSTNDRICYIHFDLMGCRYLYLRSYADTDGATELTTVGAIISAY